MPKINLKGFEDTEVTPPMLDPGSYAVKITQAPVEEWDDQNRNYMDIYMMVVSGPQQKNGDAAAGKDTRDRIYLHTPKSWFRLKQLLVAAGLMERDDKESPMAKGDIDTDLLAGQSLQIEVSINMRDGKEYRNTQYVF